MAINTSDDYDRLAALIYPSIEVSGNKYYGETKKLITDETFNKNELNFCSHIETVRESDGGADYGYKYTSYFNWKIGPLYGSINVGTNGGSGGNKCAVTTSNPFVVTVFPSKTVTIIPASGSSTTVYEGSNPVPSCTLFAKYTLVTSETTETVSTGAGNFNIPKTALTLSATAPVAIYTANLDPVTKEAIDSDRNFFVDSTNLYIKVCSTNASGVVSFNVKSSKPDTSVVGGTYKNSDVVASGGDSASNTGRGSIATKSTMYDMNLAMPAYTPDTYNEATGSYNQDVWGIKSFNSPVIVRNGIYGEVGCLTTSGDSTSSSVMLSSYTNNSKNANIQVGYTVSSGSATESRIDLNAEKVYVNGEELGGGNGIVFPSEATNAVNIGEIIVVTTNKSSPVIHRGDYLEYKTYSSTTAWWLNGDTTVGDIGWPGSATSGWSRHTNVPFESAGSGNWYNVWYQDYPGPVGSGAPAGEYVMSSTIFFNPYNFGYYRFYDSTTSYYSHSCEGGEGMEPYLHGETVSWSGTYSINYGVPDSGYSYNNFYVRSSNTAAHRYYCDNDYTQASWGYFDFEIHIGLDIHSYTMRPYGSGSGGGSSINGCYGANTLEMTSWSGSGTKEFYLEHCYGTDNSHNRITVESSGGVNPMLRVLSIIDGSSSVKKLLVVRTA